MTATSFGVLDSWEMPGGAHLESLPGHQKPKWDARWGYLLAAMSAWLVLATARLFRITKRSSDEPLQERILFLLCGLISASFIVALHWILTRDGPQDPSPLSFLMTLGMLEAFVGFAVVSNAFISRAWAALIASIVVFGTLLSTTILLWLEIVASV